MEVGEEGERKGEVNRSEVKWNANAACPAEEEKRELALASSSCVVSRRGEERRETSGGWRLLQRECEISEE